MLPMQVSYWTLQENKRHNQRTEDQKDTELKETNRANLAREFETNRSNVAKEFETNRHNVATEMETHRSNVATEFETHRANTARETETNRHNLRTEYIDTRKANAAEQQAKASNRTASVKEQEEKRQQELHPSTVKQAKASIAKTGNDIATSWFTSIAKAIGAAKGF